MIRFGSFHTSYLAWSWLVITAVVFLSPNKFSLFLIPIFLILCSRYKKFWRAPSFVYMVVCFLVVRLAVIVIEDGLSLHLIIEAKVIGVLLFLWVCFNLRLPTACSDGFFFGLVVVVVWLYLGEPQGRFLDKYILPNVFSNYFGFIFGLWFLAERDIFRRVIAFGMVLLCFSSTSIIAMSLAFFLELWRKHKCLAFIMFPVLAIIFGLVLSAAFQERGRDIVDVMEWDRLQWFLMGWEAWIRLDFSEKFFGLGFGRSIDLRAYSASSSMLLEWAAGNWRGTPALVLHNEWFRILFNSGVVGLIFMALVFIRVFRLRMEMLVYFVIGGFGMSVLYPTSVAVAFGIILACREENDERSI